MAILFDYPLNYGAGRSQHREVADNDYTTFTSQTALLLNIDTAGDGTGDARDWTDIFVKCTGVESYTLALTDAENISTPAPRTLPDTVINDSGDSVSTIVENYQHDLHNLWTNETAAKPKAKAMTLTFTAETGETARIYEVMILDRRLTLNSDGGFSRIEYENLDLGVNDADLRGRLSYIPPLGGERDKWLCRLTALSHRRGTERDTLADALVRFIRTHKNFVFAAEPNRYPERVFPAVWADPQTAIRYINRWKGAGRRVSFSIREA